MLWQEEAARVQQARVRVEADLRQVGRQHKDVLQLKVSCPSPIVQQQGFQVFRCWSFLLHFDAVRASCVRVIIDSPMGPNLSSHIAVASSPVNIKRKENSEEK